MKKYDIGVFGATGYTGELISRYIAKNVRGVTWCMYGRSVPKLDSLQSSIKGGENDDLPINVEYASVDDLSSLDGMSASCRVVINCVGPFAQLGEAVIQSCLKNKTHYIDISGEPAFLNNVAKKYESECKDILVVPACGFDSVPCDLGVFFTEAHINTNIPYSIKGSVEFRNSGFSNLMSGISSGTFTTLLNSFANAKPARGGQKRRAVAVAHYDECVQRYLVPFQVADSHVVRRTGYLRYGDDYKGKYSHFLEFKGWMSYQMYALFFGFLMKASKWSLVRTSLIWLKEKLFGKGPSSKKRETASFQFTFQAVESETGKKVVSTVAGPEMYDATAVCATHAALCALNAKPETYGVKTAASAFGDELVKRLNDNNIVFRIKEK